MDKTQFKLAIYVSEALQKLEEEKEEMEIGQNDFESLDEICLEIYVKNIEFNVVMEEERDGITLDIHSVGEGNRVIRKKGGKEIERNPGTKSRKN